jgi:hypothetical protein
METRADVIAKQKPKRIPLGRRNVLTVSGLKDQDEFHYHWFNDVDERLQQCVEAGYEFVGNSGLQVGDKTVESARGTDSITKKAVGGGKIAYLMRIPMELYKEDQTNKQRDVDLLDANLKAPEVDGKYGKVEINRK